MKLNEEIYYYVNKFSLLKEKPNYSSTNLFIKEKNDILMAFSKYFNKTLLFINTIILNTICNFGNCLILLNKLLFYCEIIGCKNIVLNKDFYWFIKNNITIKELNLSISVNEYKNYNKNSSLIYDSFDLLYFSFNFKPEIRITYLRDEILCNIPHIDINENDLYIHIRSGNVFNHSTHINYPQPPLCFYRNILNYFKFRQIYIIAKDTRNPIINKLLKEYPIIIFLQDTLEKHISLLINAYNIVNSISSFVNSIIQLNYNLQFLWEFNIYHMSEKIFHYHHELFKYLNNNFTTFKMEPSSNYINRMFEWKYQRSQLVLMIKEKCINDFTIIKK